MLVMSESKEVRSMRQRRGEIVDQAREITNKGANISAADQKKFDALMAESDQLAAAIKRANGVDILDAELSQPLNNRRAGLEQIGPDEHGDPDNVWVNTKTGERINVLAKGQSLAAQFPAHAAPRANLGDVVRAMLNPASVGPDIRAALIEGSGPGGGYTVDDSLSATIIDRMRARASVTRAGALTVNMPTADVKIARLNGDPSASWRGEASLVNESTPAFGQITLRANSLATIIKLSRELAEDSMNLDVALRNAIAKAFALEVDRAAMFGVGAAAEPLGVVNRAINEVELGSGDGGQLTGYDDFLDGLFELRADNAAEPTAAILSPRTAKTLDKKKDGQGLPLIKPPAIANLPMMITTSVPDNSTVGINSDCSTIVMGDFREMIIGVRSELRIELLKERYADNLMFGLLCWMRADVAVMHDESFCKITGVRV
ncbi:phage major capsid protein [Methylocystis sp.]|uniref:phage major capsid protein n=1 Tax=Methylocystis sp. TaxID=1911079 RepID=UPI003DA67A62